MRFDSYHPAINLIFFAAVIVFTVLWSHPVFMAISYACAFIYSVKLNGRRALVFNLVLIPLAGLWTVWFATHFHFGITNLGQTVIGNQVTLEAIARGAAQGVQIASVLMWLSCVLAIFTTDKVVYLLGRVLPKLSIMVAIVARAVPVIKDRIRRISIAQKGIGRGAGQGSAAARIRNWVRRVSMIVTWTIERFVETAESMRSRGSALRGRTAYSLYRFDNRDRSYVLFLVFAITVCIAGMMLDQTRMLYEPELIMNHITPLSCVFFIAYAALCLSPFILQVVGEARFAVLVKNVREPGACQ